MCDSVYLDLLITLTHLSKDIELGMRENSEMREGTISFLSIGQDTTMIVNDSRVKATIGISTLKKYFKLKCFRNF